MAGSPRVICASGDLKDGGEGVRFETDWEGERVPGFAVRFQGRVYAYLNRCAHVGVELDWAPGAFFDDSGLYLLCSTHGAVYEPETGRCAGGPCRGASLIPLSVAEHDGRVFLDEGVKHG